MIAEWQSPHGATWIHRIRQFLSAILGWDQSATEIHYVGSSEALPPPLPGMKKPTFSHYWATVKIACVPC